jgi:hypothetical protein
MYGDGKAGQNAKRTAFSHTVRIVRIAMATMLVAGIGLGLLISVQIQQMYGPSGWLRTHLWFCLAIEILIFASAFLSLRRLDKYADDVARERIKWLRGAQGEALVAWHLRDLPDSWHVFHNIQIWENGDVDHILIGPAGIFCLSTKANRGLYSTGPDGSYLLNGETTNHVYDAQRQALQFRDRLKGLLGNAPWIQPVLVAPFAYVGFDTFQDQAWVLYEGNLNTVFEDSRCKLNAREIAKYADAVRKIANVEPMRSE